MSVCDVPVISTVCAAAGEGAASLVTAPFDWLAQAMAGTAAWLFTAVWQVFDTTTLVDVTKPEYVHVYDILFGVAVFVMLVFFCLQLLTGLIHRDPAALSRAALGLAKAVLGSFLLLTLTGLLLQISDQLAVGIVQATGNTMSGMGTQIGLLAAGLATITIAAPGVGAILTIFLAGLAITAAAIVWFSLLIRKALLLVAIVFGPIALAGATWEATKGWFARWASFVIALIFSKLVLVVIFLVAIGQTSSPINADLASISDPIAGIVLMFVAAFAPYITYKFISFVGFDMYHAMSSEQEAKQALNRPVPIPATPSADTTKKILDAGGGSANTPTSNGGGSTPTPRVLNGGSAAGEGGAAATSSGAATGTGAGAGAGASAGAGAAAGPVGVAAVAGAAVVTGAATAGPKLGAAVAEAAEGHAGAVAEQPPPPAQANRPTPSAALASSPPPVPPAPDTTARPGPGRSDPPPPSSSAPSRTKG